METVYATYILFKMHFLANASLAQFAFLIKDSIASVTS